LQNYWHALRWVFRDALKITITALFLLVPAFFLIPKVSATSPPIVCIDTPTQSQSFSTGSLVRVSGWVIAPQGVRAVSVKIDGSDAPNLSYNIAAEALPTRSDVSSVMSSYPGASGNKAYEAYFNTNNIGYGTHSVYVYVTDKNGNTMTGVKTFNVIAPPPPIVCIDTPSPSQSFSDGNLIRVSGWVIAPQGVRAVSVKVDGSDASNLSYNIGGNALPTRGDVSSALSYYPGASSNKAYDVYFNTHYLSGGTHTVYVYVTDNNGNTMTGARTFNVTAPPPPIVCIDTPSSSQNFVGGNLVRVSGWTIAPRGVSSVSVKVDGSNDPNLSYNVGAGSLPTRGDFASVMSAYPGASSNKAYDVYFNTNYIASGTHTAYVYVTDTYGNTMTSARTFTVTKPPSYMSIDNVQASINGAQTVTNYITGSFTVNG
jgi:hypothetical protein